MGHNFHLEMEDLTAFWFKESLLATQHGDPTAPEHEWAYNIYLYVLLCILFLIQAVLCRACILEGDSGKECESHDGLLNAAVGVFMVLIEVIVIKMTNTLELLIKYHSYARILWSSWST